uniref:GST C-terminal domain-containing protein n=1 Tax=Corethron hystrix TaxID=216773 RepID=A0A7S1BTY9_9STRA|mmetsp:Transcript_40945/g.96100  ORF Transcript_40945/g.96100 Transcript_40945/m.96100 type:complete len:295 (+) Transcript_40945:629-1513(+)
MNASVFTYISEEEPSTFQLNTFYFFLQWCHRARLALKVRQIIDDEVGLTYLVDDPVRASRGGWVFDKKPGYSDPIFASNDLRQLYERMSPGFKGRCTAPLLVDSKRKEIISNESSDIVRMLGTASFGREDLRLRTAIDLYPPDLAKIIDETNIWVYELLNNGVYQCGFSTTQVAYDRASAGVRRGLERCNDILSNNDFLCGPNFTEADLRLLPTVLRFDGSYAPLFRAGGAHLRIRDFPNLHKWLIKCWHDVPGVKDSIDIQDANSSYYRQLFPLNPGGLIPTAITAKDIGLEA